MRQSRPFTRASYTAEVARSVKPRGRPSAARYNFAVLAINQCKAHANIYFPQFNFEMHIGRLSCGFFLIYGTRHRVHDCINISDKCIRPCIVPYIVPLAALVLFH